MPWLDEWHEMFVKWRSGGGMLLDIKEPPCKDCIFWKPRIATDKYGEPDGIALCTSQYQFRDFSCYQPKEDE